LVPLVHRRDQWHPAVVRQVRALQMAGSVDFVTTNWTLYEAFSVLKRAGHHRCVELARFAEDSIATRTVDPVIEEQAVGRFLAWADKGASVVDHANLLVALELRCGGLITYDSDFDAIAHGTGIRLLR